MPFYGLTDEQIRETAPSVFATHAGPGTSDRYAYLPSYQVVREMRTLGLMPMEVREGKKKMPDGRAFALHQITFRPHDFHSRAPELGELTPEVLFLNSHDRTSGLSFSAGLQRAICRNGMRTDDETVGNFKVRHTGKGRLDELHRGMHVLLNKLDDVLDVAQAWSEIQLTPFQASQFATKALDIKGTALSISTETVLRPRRYHDQGNSLWLVFNRVQENIMRGGLYGRTASGKRSTLREIKSLATDIDFNKKLWGAASELAREVRPSLVSVA